MPKFFTKEEEARIAAHIRRAESITTGEIRVFVEPRLTGEVRDRALYIFGKHKVYKTRDRNALLIYIAYESHHFFLWGDENFHKRIGQNVLNELIDELLSFFKSEKYADGLCFVIDHVGKEMANHFPYDGLVNKNELSNDIIYGTEKE